MALRVGVIGCGMVFERHLHGWQRAGAKVVAVADLDPAKAAQAAAAAGAAQAYRTPDELLADPAVQAVDICLPHHLHRSVTLAAFEQGLEVVCEKPIATTLADADAMLAASAASGRLLLIAEQCRFEPAVPLTRRLLDEGLIGQVQVVHTVMAWWQGGGYLQTGWRFAAGAMGGQGGALIDGGIHYVDLLLHLLGRPREVSALTRRSRDCYAGEDTAVVTARFADEVLGVLTIAASTRHGRAPMFSVYGTAGHLNAWHGRVEVVSDGLPGGRTEYELDRTSTYDLELQHFHDCLTTGCANRSDGHAARLNLEFVLAAYESAASGRLVALPECAGG
ncbi:MAG: Gfo/Idh/MocA family oxidoreductase [Fimbriimonadaceae bacterium]|nr:Gfo/Idh/MocA family oxidoreductase [Fimbriimonadaceae bacterium]